MAKAGAPGDAPAAAPAAPAAEKDKREPVGEPEDLPDGRKRYLIHGTKFDVPKRYNVTKAIGFGAYGFVCAGVDTSSGTRVAIKKCQNVFNELEDGKRILREIKLLSFLRHENLVSILDLLPPGNPRTFEDMYIVQNLMDTDLQNVLRSKQKLTEEHFQYFIYQMLRGLKYLHSARVIHRDLKPANILVNISCDLRVCDFGLARGMDPSEAPPDMTDYVVTRWYRPPELLLMSTHYTTAVDIWSVGCIFAEMVSRKALFPGKDFFGQLKLIVEGIGYPPEASLTWLQNADARRYAAQLPKTPARPISALVPKLGNKLGEDFLSRMLQFNPADRATAADLLAHPYLSHLHDAADEPTAPAPFKWKDDTRTFSAASLRAGFWEEICRFNPELASADGPLPA